MIATTNEADGHETGMNSHIPGASTGADTLNQPWSFALFAVLTTIAIVIAALAAPWLAVAVIDQFAGAGDQVQSGVPSAIVSWSHLLSFQAATILLTIMMAQVAIGAGPSLGWQPPVGRRQWLLPLQVTVAISVVTSFIAFTFFPDIVAGDLAPIRAMIEGAPLWLSFLALAVGAPVSEELLFRGYLLHRLRQTPLGFWGGALIANTGWTLLHVGYSWLSLADVFLAGLLFSWALWRTRSIWVPIAFHAAYNAVVYVILLIPPTHSPLPAGIS